MKTKILSIALIALMLGMVVSSNAADADTNRRKAPYIDASFQADINLFPDNVVKFLVVKPDEDKVKLRVYDDANTLLYTYTLKKQSSARIGFDISPLEAGKYHFVIERNKKEVLRKTITKVALGK